MKENVEVLYYSKKDLIGNQALYYPDQKNSNPLDISFLEQVKANTYSEDGTENGLISFLNCFNTIKKEGLNTGIVSLKTKDGILSWINVYDTGETIQPYLPDIVLFAKVIFASGIYLKNGLDVFVKITRFNDENLTRKIEIFY